MVSRDMLFFSPANAPNFTLKKPDSGTGTLRLNFDSTAFYVSGGNIGYTDGNIFMHARDQTGANIGNRGGSPAVSAHGWRDACGTWYFDWKEGSCDLDAMGQNYEGRNYDGMCPKGSVAVGITGGIVMLLYQFARILV